MRSICSVTLLLFSLLTNAQPNGKWEFSVAAFVNHNDLFHEPKPFTPSTYVGGVDRTPFQPYPTFGFGGGFLAERVYRVNKYNYLMLRTGILFTQYYTLDKLSPAMANYYYSYSQSVLHLNLNQAGYLGIEFKTGYGLVAIPVNFGYRYKNLKVFFGAYIAPLIINTEKTISYNGTIDKSVTTQYGFNGIPNSTLQYAFERFRTDIFLGIDFDYREQNYYKLGLEYHLTLE
jgi:hypothetical protein